MERKLIIALDFDGVLHGYSKEWHDGTIYDPPIKGTLEALDKLQDDGYEFVVFTCRDKTEDIEAWILQQFGIYIRVTNGKPYADMYIDDRGWHFQNWEDTLKEIDRRAKEGWIADGFKRQSDC